MSKQPFKPGELIFVEVPSVHKPNKGKGWICKYLKRTKQTGGNDEPIVQVQIIGRQRPTLVSMNDCYHLKPEHHEMQRATRVKAPEHKAS